MYIIILGCTGTVTHMVDSNKKMYYVIEKKPQEHRVLMASNNHIHCLMFLNLKKSQLVQKEVISHCGSKIYTGEIPPQDINALQIVLSQKNQFRYHIADTAFPSEIDESRMGYALARELTDGYKVTDLFYDKEDACLFYCHIITQNTLYDMQPIWCNENRHFREDEKINEFDLTLIPQMLVNIDRYRLIKMA